MAEDASFPIFTARTALARRSLVTAAINGCRYYSGEHIQIACSFLLSVQGRRVPPGRASRRNLRGGATHGLLERSPDRARILLTSSLLTLTILMTLLLRLPSMLLTSHLSSRLSIDFVESIMVIIVQQAALSAFPRPRKPTPRALFPGRSTD